MDILAIMNWIIASGPNMLASLVIFLGFLIAFFALIPGEQPEKALQGIVDFIAKFSKK